MASQIHLLPDAERDLEAIHAYTVSEWGEKQACRYLGGLRRAFDTLAAHPRIGAEAKPGSGVRVWPYKRHRIIYRESSGVVEVGRIFHSARSVDLVQEYYAAQRRASQ